MYVRPKVTGRHGSLIALVYYLCLSASVRMPLAHAIAISDPLTRVCRVAISPISSIARLWYLTIPIHADTARIKLGRRFGQYGVAKRVLGHTNVLVRDPLPRHGTPPAGLNLWLLDFSIYSRRW
ncbi:hypothetical protein BC827DRAFT_1154622 [Russula dissimulans]|jgi:hypothetical protein|nr:hypothetical protein BC827DRAFT_1154622 [Russula dissimulans]